MEALKLKLAMQKYGIKSRSQDAVMNAVYGISKAGIDPDSLAGIQSGDPNAINTAIKTAQEIRAGKPVPTPDPTAVPTPKPGLVQAVQSFVSKVKNNPIQKGVITPKSTNEILNGIKAAKANPTNVPTVQTTPSSPDPYAGGF